MVLAGFAALMGTARADENPVAAIYAAAEVEPLRARYEKGWLGNYERVFVPSFSAEERQRLSRVRFEFAMSDPPNEPFAFHTRKFGIAAEMRFAEPKAVEDDFVAGFEFGA